MVLEVVLWFRVGLGSVGLEVCGCRKGRGGS